MNNEEKILSILEQMQKDVSGLKEDVASLKQGQAEIREELETIKEDTAITREATNTLLDWAEKAQVQISIPLYNKEA